jgi:exodeoxyribonuclease III
MALRIATWNINSIRHRLTLARRFARSWKPDVMCFQETKVVNEDFPRAGFEDLGYPHFAIHGQKGYHGVAIVSRLPLTDIGTRQWCGSADARHVFATLPGGVELHNFYIPAGGDVPDPATNPKFDEKLRFYRELETWGAALDNRPRVLVGDLNVAPLETDVWSHKQLLRIVSHTPVEVDHYDRAFAAHDWIDAMRQVVPADQQLYTWWSYRAADWRRANKGRRLDHIWINSALKPALESMEVAHRVRSWKTPSDHVPVLIDLDV